MAVKYREHHLQAAQVKWLARQGYLYSGDQNAVRRGYKAQKLAKDTGMVSGRPDLDIFLDSGRTLFVENKVYPLRPSPAQEAFHSALRALGHHVVVIRVKTPEEAIAALQAALDAIPHIKPTGPPISRLDTPSDEWGL